MIVLGGDPMELSCGMWIPVGSLAHSDDVVANMIRAICLPGHGSDGKGVFDIETNDTRPIGGRQYQSSASLYCVFDTIDRDEEAEEHVEAVFGFRPEPGSYSIGSDDDGDDANRMLAEFVAFLAEQAGGVVEFGCLPQEAPNLPGRTLVLHRSTADEPREWRVLLDAVAMRAWSQNPRCWMYREGKDT
jgi:hypothetical protein